MKALTIVVPLLLAAFLVDAAWASSCSDEFTCTENKKIWAKHEFSACSSIFGGFGSDLRSLEAKTQNLASKHLRASMKYLLLASEFNTWKTDRPGLREYFSKMSDAAFDHAVNIIKHMTKRGGKLSNTFNVTMPSISYKVSEIEALTLVLDEEKHLANETINVIHSAGHGSKEHMRLPDGELAHFLAEEIAEKHADRIHDLAVHVNNLGAAIQDSRSKGQDPSFIIYMYDTQFM